MDEVRARLRAQLVMPDGRRFGDVMAEFQGRDFAALDSGRYRHAYIERARGGSKTFDAAAEAVVELFLGPEGGRLYAAAADKDQAGLLHEAAAGWIQRTPLLRDRAIVDRWRITTDRGAMLTALAADAPGSYGLAPTWVCCDELAQWTDFRGDELWHALWTSTGKRDARMLVITTAGWDRTSLCWRVRDNAQREPTWYFSSLAASPPWIKREWLDEQRRTLPGPVYARLHENRWVEGADSFLSPAEIDAIFDPRLRPLAQRLPEARHVIGLDLGLTDDRSVAAVAHRERTTGHIVCDLLRTWSGTEARPVDLADVEDEVYRLAATFGAPVRVDPYQSVLMGQRLARRGVRVTEFDFTGASRRRLFGMLLQLVRDRHLRAYPHDELRRELLGLEVQETSSGWRVDHRARAHDDHVVALGLAATDPTLHTPMLTLRELQHIYGW